MKLTLEVSKVIIRRTKDKPETVNLELSEELSRRLYGESYELHNIANLRLTVDRDTGEKVCEELGILPAIIEVIDDTPKPKKEDS